MKAVLIHATGSPDVLHYEEADRLEPDEGEVVIRVHAASVNPVDWKQRRTGSPRQGRLRDRRGVARRGLRGR